jgi:hypothetical protein
LQEGNQFRPNGATMIDPASYLLIANTTTISNSNSNTNTNANSTNIINNISGNSNTTNTSNTNHANLNGAGHLIDGLANSINSLSDFEQSTSGASSGSSCHYGDPFVGGLSYFDQTQLDQTDPTSSLTVSGCELDDEDDDLIHGTLTGFVCADLGSDSDNCYTTSGVSDGLFTSSDSLVDCSDFKQFSFSDLHGLIDMGNSTPKQLATSTEKRSVLMNLLIYGTDIGAGYTLR